MSNPYNRDSIIGRAYDALKETDAPVSVTSLAGIIGATYSALYNAIHKDSVKAIELKTDNGVRCAALVRNEVSTDSEEAIIENMQGAKPMRIADIAVESGVSEATARAFIAEQNKLGNIEITPARNQADYKYEWVGPIRTEVMPEHEAKADDEAIARLEHALDSDPEPASGPEVGVTPIETHETPMPKGSVGNVKAVESVYMVVVNGETRLCKTEDEALEIGGYEAEKSATVFIYEVKSAKQIVYQPATLEHDLASLCS